MNGGHYSDQCLDALENAIKERSIGGKVVPYKELEDVIENNSNRTLVTRTIVQRAVLELVKKGRPIYTVNREGYIYVSGMD